MNYRISEIYEIGRSIDVLEDDYCSSLELTDNISYELQRISKYFTDPIKYEEDIEYKIIYNYTYANFLSFIITISKKYFNEIKKTIKDFEFKSSNDLKFKFNIKRINLFRESIKLNNENKNSKFDPMYISQIHTNLANLYNEVGLILDSIEELEPIKFNISMALGNYAVKLVELSKSTLDNFEKKELLIAAKSYLEFLFSKDCDASMYDIAFEGFLNWLKFINNELNNYSNIEIYEEADNKYPCNVDIKNSVYRTWCMENMFSLSFKNIIDKNSCVDDIHLPNLGISYYSKDKKLTYYSWFNTIKQEFNMARYFLFKVSISENEIHESQEDILLVNTLDYQALGYRSELLKTSLKTSYGVLDKIGMVCYDFVTRDKNNLKISKVSFTSWYKDLEKEIAIYSEFSSLYYLAGDMNAEHGKYKDFRKLRNVLEHRFIRVLDYYNTSIENELKGDEKSEYTISFDELYRQAFELLKLVRKAIFYLVFAFNQCFENAKIDICNESSIYIPMSITIIEDDWKN